MSAPSLFASGLTWPESPRWHNGALYLSDCYNFRVVKIVPGEVPATLADVPGRPAGIDFFPDGRLLVGSALDRKLWWVTEQGTIELALDLSDGTNGNINDIVVDDRGRAWIGITGYSLETGEAEQPGTLYSWLPGETPVVAANGLRFPNGIAITPDGRTLYLCETMAHEISAFDINPDGALSNKRVHATLPNGPDGLCLDAEDALWVAVPFEKQFLRIDGNGAVIDTVQLDDPLCIACVLGGNDRQTLFLAVSKHEFGNPDSIPDGSILTLERPVAGAGRP